MDIYMLLSTLTLAASLRHGCESDIDCSLNGVCDTFSGACACDPAWKGSTCSRLNLLPMDKKNVINGAYKPGASTSWGANVLQSSEDGLYHMFVAEMKGNCTLTSWIPNSQIVHAVATALEGPYAFRDLLFDTFHHNPRLTRDPSDGSFLLFMIGGPLNSTASQGCAAIPARQGELFDTRILVSRATSLNGPWSAPKGPLVARGAVTEWDYVVTNPTPIVLPNGTTLMYYRGTPKYWSQSNAPLDLPESVGLAVAPHWSGPYTKVFADPILKVMNEDPFAWKNERGFHLLTHGRNDWWNTHHSYSVDGLTWSSGADVAADPNITLASGEIYRFTNRERPQIYFNESTGAPAVLFNGVCPDKKYTYAYTLAQAINQA